MTYLRVESTAANLGELEAVRGSLVGGTATHVDAYVVPDDLWLLDLAGVEYEVLAEDYRDLRPGRGGGYHDNAGIEAELEGLAAQYPDLVRMVDVGESILGRPIVGVVITADVRRREPRPGFRLLGAHHGDEWSSMEVTLELAHVLVDEYGSAPDITALLDAREVWVVPVVNPDGLEAFERYNDAGTDLNRNYSYEWSQWEYASGPYEFSEPETMAIRALGTRRRFVHSLSLHSGAVLCNYLWNYTTQDSPDEALLLDICEIYEAATPTPDFWVTNGADWYVTRGDTNDWSYGVWGGQDHTLEVTLQKTPPAAEIPTYLDWHVDPSLGFLDEGLRLGVEGQITDAVTGMPLEARVTNQPDGWPVAADPDTGAYQRMLFAGNHQLLFEAPGYQPQTVLVQVPQGQTATVDVALAPLNGGVSLERAVPSVIDFDGPVVQVLLHGAALTGWATGVRLQRWDGDSVDLPVTEVGNDLLVEIDPGDLDPWYSREGLWWVTAEGPGGAAGLPRGIVVVGDGDPAFALSGVVTQPDAGGPGVHRVTVDGSELPRGADLLLFGPGGAVAWPDEVESESGSSFSALFDGGDLADGTWDVVLYGGAHYRALDDALHTQSGEFVAGDDDDAGDDDTAGDDDAGDDDTAGPAPGDDDDWSGTPSDDQASDGDVLLAGEACECSARGSAPPASAAFGLLILALAARRKG